MKDRLKGLEFCAEQERYVTPDDHLDYHAGPGPWPRECPYGGCRAIVASAQDLADHAREEH